MSKLITEKPRSELIFQLCKKHGCGTPHLFGKITTFTADEELNATYVHDLWLLHNNGYYLPFTVNILARHVRRLNVPMIELITNTASPSQLSYYQKEYSLVEARKRPSLGMLLWGSFEHISDDDKILIEKYMNTVRMMIKIYGSSWMNVGLDDHSCPIILDRVSGSLHLTRFIFENGFEMRDGFWLYERMITPDLMRIYIEYGGSKVANPEMIQCIQKTPLTAVSAYNKCESCYVIYQEMARIRRREVILACYLGMD